MFNRPTRRLPVALTIGTVALAHSAVAQAPPPHFAITDVRIVVGDGSVVDRGTIIVRDGLIAAVGAEVSAPVGAWSIDGSGLTAYPGLIDALSTVGLPAELRDQADSGNNGGRPEAADDDYARGRRIALPRSPGSARPTTWTPRTRGSPRGAPPASPPSYRRRNVACSPGRPRSSTSPENAPTTWSWPRRWRYR